MITVKTFSIRGVSKEVQEEQVGKVWTKREDSPNIDLF